MAWFSHDKTACTWLLYEFSVAGSYLRDVQGAPIPAADTQQFWITSEYAWDTRTFAMDRDIHVRRVELSTLASDPVGFFEGVAERSYGDIIHRRVRLTARETDSPERLRAQVTAAGWFAHVERTVHGFPLWLPEHATYHTQSKPR